VREVPPLHIDPAATGPPGPAEDLSIPPSTIPTYENKGWYCFFAARPLIFGIVNTKSRMRKLKKTS
jgi:hypothetical protein